MMKKLGIILLLLGMTSYACAGDAAYTIRATELKAKPYSDAQTLRSLPPRTKVEVLKRQSRWTQVKAGTTSGWVKMLSLQLEASAAGRRSDNGLSALFNIAATGRGSSTVTTGVRGLSEEQLKTAQSNPRALQAAKKYAVSRSEAERFADEGKLLSHDVDYLSGGR
jgi:uncharacterized protein YgiM (DUF1202 family)